MNTASDRIVDKALSLPVEERLNLVEKLLMSLNLPIDDEIDRLWAEEAERRFSEIEEGKVTPIPGKEAVISVRGKGKYVVMDLQTYNRLRECELEAALYETRREIAEGKGIEESVEAHIKRLQREES